MRQRGAPHKEKEVNLFLFYILFYINYLLANRRKRGNNGLSTIFR
jgi:hypothetical protein